MSSKQQLHTDGPPHITAANKGPGSTALHVSHPDVSSTSSPLSTASTAMSLSSRAPTSGWAQLPTELLLLVLGYSSFRTVLYVMLVNSRLYRLVREPSSSVATSSSTVWRNYPPATVHVDEYVTMCDTKARDVYAVEVNDETFLWARRDGQYASSLLFVLRHVTALQLSYSQHYKISYWVEHVVPSALFSSLQHFAQLRSLSVLGVQYIAAASCAAALDSLPSLTSLELHSYALTESDELTAALHRLCSTQLNHLTISRRRLYYLLQYQQGAAVMPRLVSLMVTTAAYLPDERRSKFAAIQPSYIAHFPSHFPSLAHLTVRCEVLLGQLRRVQLPQLSSFNVLSVLDDLSHINTRLYCLDCTWATMPVNRLLPHAPRMEQLAIINRDDGSDGDVYCDDDFDSWTLFPQPSAAPTALSQLTYLEVDNCLPLADWHYLLNSSSPPIFAARLTHLVLRVRRWHQAAVALLLPSLPSMYPSLTHLHIGELLGDFSLARHVKWEAAKRAVRAAVGAAWCDSAADVVAWREDVAWRRSVGVPQ